MHGDDLAHGLLGYRVVSGIGEELGHVTGLREGRDGRAKAIAFVEVDGDAPRFVPLRFIRHIGEGEIRLAGPREGFHITRVRERAMGDVPMEDDDESFWGAS